MPEATDIEDARVVRARISASAITVESCAAAVESSAAGAVVTFAGVVRDHDGGRGVTALSYTAHPDAEATLRTVAGEVAERHPAVVIAIEHRTGDLVVGDIALACAVASAHRGAAFAACSELIDEVKERVQIWKEQSFDDGSTEWVASLG